MAVSELTLKKGCVILANEGHSQYCEWPLLARITQPFYSANSLLITHSYGDMKNPDKILVQRHLYNSILAVENHKTKCIDSLYLDKFL